MTTKAQQPKRFLYGKGKFSTATGSGDWFNSPLGDLNYISWLSDDIFLGLDKVTLSQDLHVATGINSRRPGGYDG